MAARGPVTSRRRTPTAAVREQPRVRRGRRLRHAAERWSESRRALDRAGRRSESAPDGDAAVGGAGGRRADRAGGRAPAGPDAGGRADGASAERRQPVQPVARGLQWRLDEWRPTVDSSSTGAVAWTDGRGVPAGPGPAERRPMAGASADTDDPNTEYPMWEPDPDPLPARALLPDGAAEMENADTQLMPPPSTRPRRPGDGGLAELADHGRGLPVRSRQRRRTPPPAGSAAARSRRRVRSCCRGRSWRCCGPPTAAHAEVDRAVLIGRAPSGQRSSARAAPADDRAQPRSRHQPDPPGGGAGGVARSWSPTCTPRTVRSWSVPAGSIGSRCRPVRRSRCELGSVVELGDGISVLVDFPQ